MVENVKTYKIGRRVGSQKELLFTYYTFIMSVYGIHLTNPELGVLVFTALYGTISTPPAKNAFIKEYNSSKGSLANYISKLKRMKLLEKDEYLKIRLIKKLQLEDADEYLFKINIRIDNG